MAIPQTKPIRVLLIDDQAIVRFGLRLLIESRPGLKVAGEAGNRADALKVASREQPDVIVLTGIRDVEKRDLTIELGAKGVVLKENGAGELLNAIEKVYRTGEYWLEPGAAGRLLGKKTARAGEQQADPE